MGILDTKELADALCTVIALGFIIKSKDDHPSNSYIIFHEGKGQEDKDTEHQHLQLQAKLAKLTNSKDLLEFKTQIASNKSNQPIIMAQTKKSVMQGDFTDKERAIFNRLEEEIKDYTVKNDPKIPLKGAYVGGILSVSNAELLDPSILYWYEPDYRKFSSEESEEAKKLRIEKSYNNALSVTETVQDFLGSVFSEGHTLKHGGTLIRRPDKRPLDAKLDKPTGADLFASVHGMTQSIIHYSGSSDPNKVNIELALSRDTCKVASCIPCSIFMWANKTPATATHFGRGDNWNFPPNVFELIRKCSCSNYLTTLAGYPYAINWMEHVWTAYNTGSACIKMKLGSKTPKDLDDATKLSQEKIPQMFLEALTHEGSFLDKMLSTLKNVPD